MADIVDLLGELYGSRSDVEAGSVVAYAVECLAAHIDQERRRMAAWKLVHNPECECEWAEATLCSLDDIEQVLKEALEVRE